MCSPTINNKIQIVRQKHSDHLAQASTYNEKDTGREVEICALEAQILYQRPELCLRKVTVAR